MTNKPTNVTEGEEAVRNAKANIAVRRQAGHDCVWLACDTVETILSALPKVDEETVERVAKAIAVRMSNNPDANPNGAEFVAARAAIHSLIGGRESD